MVNKLYYTVFETRLGWVGILGTKAGLLSTTLPHSTRQKIIDYWGKPAEGAILSPKYFKNLEQNFRNYYEGKQTEFPIELDLTGATQFQKQVWKACQSIPYGETRNYGWIAEKIGKPKGSRAVGGALHKNPFPVIVPCHRVIAGDGKLGGFAGGLDIKIQLLEMEKAKPRQT